MSKEDAVILASRTLAVLLVVWALAETSQLPSVLYAFRHYSSAELSTSVATDYYRHSHLISLSFLLVRIIGFSMMARWLFKGGPDITELLLPSDRGTFAPSVESQ
jgi:hypothetical protein